MTLFTFHSSVTHGEQALACVLVMQAISYAVVTVLGTGSLLALGASAQNTLAEPNRGRVDRLR